MNFPDIRQQLIARRGNNFHDDRFSGETAFSMHAGARAYVTETKRAVLAPMDNQGCHLSARARARIVRVAAEKRQ